MSPGGPGGSIILFAAVLQVPGGEPVSTQIWQHVLDGNPAVVQELLAAYEQLKAQLTCNSGDNQCS